MKKTPIFLFTYLAFALAASLFYFFATSFVRSPEAAHSNASYQSERTSILHDAKLQTYGSDGRLLYQIQGKSLKQNADDALQFVETTARYFPLEGNHVEVQAETGTLDDEKLLFTGGVLIAKRNAQGVQTETLQTSSLEVDLLGKSAKTDSKATIRRRHLVLKGVGATVDFQTGKFLLQSSVESTHILEK